MKIHCRGLTTGAQESKEKGKQKRHALRVFARRALYFKVYFYFSIVCTDSANCDCMLSSAAKTPTAEPKKTNTERNIAVARRKRFILIPPFPKIYPLSIYMITLKIIKRENVRRQNIFCLQLGSLYSIMTWYVYAFHY